MDEAGRVHHGREHAADVDVAMAGQFLAQARGEAAQAELAGGVGGGERVGAQPPRETMLINRPLRWRRNSGSAA